MAQDVFKVVYEVSPSHPAVVAHFSAVAVAVAATMAYVESVGGLGYYTSSWDGSLHGVIFPDLIGRADHWKVLEEVYHPETPRALLCAPKKTKAAALVRSAFDATPKIPKSELLARELGWTGGHPTDGSKVYFATVHKIELPSERVFVRLPRQIGDGWQEPECMTEVTEGEYMRAIAAHNELIPEEDDANGK